MASGDTIFVLTPQASVPPKTNFSTLDTVADASSPALEIPVRDFDGAATEHADWYVTLPSQYSGATGLTFSFKYAVDGSDTDTIQMQFRVLPITDGTVLTGDLGMDGQTAVAISDTPPATPANKFNQSTTGALAKASFGSAGAGTYIVIRATRNVAIATNTDDVQLLEVLVKET